MKTILKCVLSIGLMLAALAPVRAEMPFGGAAADEELEAMRGREGGEVITLNTMHVRAALSGNQASHNVNGYNIIDHGAFTQASGITSVIQNSGNNVIIQDSTLVNVTIVP